MLESAKISNGKVASDLLLSKEHAFKDINETFTLKTPMSCNSLTAIYVSICSSYLENILEKRAFAKED